MGILHHIGRYFSFLAAALRRPQKGRVFAQATAVELEAIGVQSVGIVALLSLFMGAVIAIQTAHQVSGWIPAYTIGFTCLLYTSPSPRDATLSRMPSSA